MRTDARGPRRAARLLTSALAATALTLGAGAPAMGATSAEQVYERTTFETPSTLPSIPGDPAVPQGATVRPATPAPAVEVLPVVAPSAAAPAAPEGATLPVTGFEVMVFVVAAAVAAALGLALCIAGARRA